MPTEITGAVRADDVPQGGRVGTRKGQWGELAEQIDRDRKKGMVTVVRVVGADRDEFDKELRRMRNGLLEHLRQLGLKLRTVVVRENDREARVYLETREHKQISPNGLSQPQSRQPQAAQRRQRRG